MHQPVDSDWILVKQMFLSSTETEDENLTISVSDILIVLKILRGHHKVFIHENDPLRTLLEQLPQFQTIINLEQQNQRINLQIFHRQLL